MIGETIGNFKIVSRLGRGGMGEVWLAEQQSIGTKVAIKLLNADISEDTEHVTRFFNEARAVSRIQHAGIVKIFDVGHHAGHAYLIMEYLEGETLAQRIGRTRRLPLDELADIGRQIASVLDATHNAGITHRDLKPDNIFIVPDRELARGERVKILDFGIAKLTGTLAVVSPRTTGTMGTPAYMAPEQWGDASKVDWRADLYSLGCVTFEMACGRPPFIVTNIAEACAKHLHDPPPHVRELAPGTPPDLDALVDRLLAKSPDARAASMREVERAFAALAAGHPAALAATVASSSVDPMRSTSAPTPVPTTRMRTRWPLIAAASLAALVGLGLLGLYIRDRPRPVHVVTAHDHAVTAHDDHVAKVSPAPPSDVRVALAADAGIVDAPELAAAPPAVDTGVTRPKPRPAPFKEGTIDGEAVFQAVKNNTRIQRCYLEEVKKHPKLGGKLMAQVTIGVDGRGTNVHATGVSSAVSHCIELALQNMRFPRPVGGPVIANLPMTFDPPTAEELASGGTLTTTAHGAGDLPATPSPADIRAGMQKLVPELRVCADGWQGTGRLSMTIDPEGQVSKAAISGALAGTESASCVEKVVREHGRFAKSERGVSVTYPIDLRSH